MTYFRPRKPVFINGLVLTAALVAFDIAIIAWIAWQVLR